ncbi:MAG: hypothetical protein K6G74_03015 [Bacilli bacterium]|nr:hypothetical protein [Bacilli bacterium]
MKKKVPLLTLLAFALTSCVSHVDGRVNVPFSRDDGRVNAPTRVYEPFESMDAVQVENVCKSYAKRSGDHVDASSIYLVRELGVFDNVYVDLLRTDLSSLGMGVPAVCVDVVLYGTYICDRPNPSYDVNVYVDGDGSYSLKDAYDKGILNDDNIKKIAEWKTFDTPLEKFSFSLTWEDAPYHSYNSKTQELIKDYGPFRDKTREDYTTTFAYPNLEDLYEKVKEMNIYSFPNNFNAYEGVDIRTDPKASYDLTIGDKTIYARDCPLGYRYLEGLMPQGKKFLDVVFEIIDTITNSDAWKALPEIESQYK